MDDWELVSLTTIACESWGPQAVRRKKQGRREVKGKSGRRPGTLDGNTVRGCGPRKVQQRDASLVYRSAGGAIKIHLVERVTWVGGRVDPFTEPEAPRKQAREGQEVEKAKVWEIHSSWPQRGGKMTTLYWSDPGITRQVATYN